MGGASDICTARGAGGSACSLAAPRSGACCDQPGTQACTGPGGERIAHTRASAFSDAVGPVPFVPSSPASTPTPAAPPRPGLRVREGNRGTTPSPARPAHTPKTGSSAKPLPDLPPPYDPGHRPTGTRPPPAQGNDPPEPLDAKRHSLGATTGTPWSHPSCAQNWPIGR